MEEKQSILIVDDSAFLSNALKESLENRGYRITQAFDITTAKTILEDNTFDYALLDLELPDGKGESLLPYLQTHEELRVIVLTTSRDRERRENIFTFGNVVDYITKERYFADMELAIIKLIDMISSNASISVLVVDDSKFMRTKLKILLSKRNFKVYTVPSGKEAIELMKKHSIDAAIIDLEMPVMDGNQFISTIKREKKNLFMPLMVISGTSDPDRIAKVLKNGASDFIKKPFVEEELLLKIDKMIQDLKQQRLINLQQEELQLINVELEMATKKALEVSESKSNFLSSMSHEIRTPLNAIIGFIKILKKLEQDEKKYKYLEIIDQSSKTLTDIINDILDLSKIESGNFALEITEFNPEKEFNLLMALFTQNAAHKNINLINAISKDLPKFIRSDILRIKQILSNLLSNAIKFTPSGKNVTLRIDFQKEESRLSFHVEDEGIGISQENILEITKPFKQADSSTAREYGGTGLGLSIIEKLLVLFNSKLSIESELGKGSNFSFSLKVQEVHDVEEEEKNIDIENFNFSGKKILVVDDNKSNLLLMETILTDMNIGVTCINNGPDAEESFKTNRYDLILMDINMPGKDGIETMKSIKKYEQLRRVATPIVALTANSLYGDREKFLSYGFDAYLSKPIDVKELVELLQNFFN